MVEGAGAGGIGIWPQIHGGELPTDPRASAYPPFRSPV